VDLMRGPTAALSFYYELIIFIYLLFICFIFNYFKFIKFILITLNLGFNNLKHFCGCFKF
jgi:hypothetical protein